MTRDVTDVRRYSSLRTRFGASATGFPPSLPANAANARLHFFPGLLQGAAFFEVAYDIPPADAAALVVSTFTPAQQLDAIKQDWAPAIMLQLAPNPQRGYLRLRDAPPTTRIYIFDIDGDWNHNRYGGVLIDPTTGHIHWFASNG
jgi:hypothetical protein